MQHRTLGFWLMGTGVVIAGGYWLLRLTHTGKFGAPTDIGGGVLALVGYGFLLAGAVVLGASLLQRRSQRRSSL